MGCAEIGIAEEKTIEESGERLASALRSIEEESLHENRRMP
jgi:hypothetical protein